MTRVYDTPEETYLKGPWYAVGADAKRLTRIRAVWRSDWDQQIAEEVRIDFQRTDNWLEYSKFTPAYLQLLKGKINAA